MTTTPPSEDQPTPPTAAPAKAGNDPSAEEPLLRAGKAWLRDLPRNLKRRIVSKVFLYFVMAPFTAVWVSFKFVGLPLLASNTLSVWAEGQGMELTVEEWSADVLDLTATAHDITFLAPGPYAQKELLTAHSLEVDLSLWSGLFGDHWVREVRISDPSLYVERLATGRWNWQDAARLDLGSALAGALVDTGSPDGYVLAQDSRGGREVAQELPPSEGAFVIPRLTLDGMALQWVETLPSNSGGGIVQELKASLYVDDVHLTATDLVGLLDLRPEPSRLGFEARTGSGKISFDGQANLFSWSPRTDPPAGQKLAATGPGLGSAPGLAWNPSLRGRIYLENVEAGAFARLTPTALIVPTRGSLNGTMEFAVRDRQMECIANLALRDVEFAVNSSSPLINNRTRTVERDLASYRANGQYQFSCGGFLGTGEFRPFQAFQTKVVREGVREAPRRVQAVAAMDHSRYSEEPIEPELEGEVAAISSSIPGEVREWLGLGLEVHREVGRPPSGGSFRKLVGRLPGIR